MFKQMVYNKNKDALCLKITSFSFTEKEFIPLLSKLYTHFNLIVDEEIITLSQVEREAFASSQLA